MNKKIIYLISIILIGSFVGIFYNLNTQTTNHSNIENSAKDNQTFNSDNSNENKEYTEIEVNNVQDALMQAVDMAKVKSRNKEEWMLKMFDSNNGEKVYSNELELLLGENDTKLDLTNSYNLNEYINSKLYVNSSKEAVELYKKKNMIENRTVKFVFNENSINDISLHPNGDIQYNYEDFKNYTGQYIRLENCTFDYLVGDGNVGKDSIYTIFANAYYPSGNGLAKNLNMRFSLDYTDEVTLNHEFNKDKTFTIEGKMMPNSTNIFLTINKCRIIK